MYENYTFRIYKFFIKKKKYEKHVIMFITEVYCIFKILMVNELL
jgi:hypothetical protein